MKNITSFLSPYLSLLVALPLVVIPMTLAGVEKDATKSQAKKVVSQKFKRATKQISPKSVETLSTQLTSPTALTKPSPATDVQIKWQVLSSGGTSGTSTNYTLLGTVAQTAVGSGSSTNFSVNSGFWQDFNGGGTCCDLAGDADDGGDVNIGDAVYIVKYAFVSGSPAPPCCDEGDADGGGDVNIGDAVYIVKYAFVPGSPAPICNSPGNLVCL